MSAGRVQDYDRRWYATGTLSVIDVDTGHPEDNIEERIHQALRGAGITFHELIVVEQLPPKPAMTRRVLVTGSREWMDYGVVASALELELMVAEFLGEGMVVVNGKARGLDELADLWARANYHRGVTYERHPADWDTFGKAAGHIRNAEMVNLGADVCLAFPLGKSPGTRGCMALARRAGIQVVNHGSEWP